MKPIRLSQSTIEELKYYVYALVDPDTQKPFYVGKGKGNRINQHLFDAKNTDLEETEKLAKIKQIENLNKEVKTIVIRHGLTKEEAFMVEDSIIDVLGIENLTNIVGGHDSDDQGLMTLKDLELKYQAEPAEFDESVLLININDKFKPAFDENDIYEATRSAWKLSKENVERIVLVCATYKGIVRGVFVPLEWHIHEYRSPRLFFTGHPASRGVQNKYLNKTVKKYIKKGNQNPVRYIFPKEGKVVDAKGNESN